jgi:hypothetical protein
MTGNKSTRVSLHVKTHNSNFQLLDDDDVKMYQVIKSAWTVNLYKLIFISCKSGVNVSSFNTQLWVNLLFTSCAQL